MGKLCTTSRVKLAARAERVRVRVCFDFWSVLHLTVQLVGYFREGKGNFTRHAHHRFHHQVRVSVTSIVSSINSIIFTVSFESFLIVRSCVCVRACVCCMTMHHLECRLWSRTARVRYHQNVFMTTVKRKEKTHRDERTPNEKKLFLCRRSFSDH